MPSTNSPLNPLEAASAAMRRNVMGEIAVGEDAASTSADQLITAVTLDRKSVV